METHFSPFLCKLPEVWLVRRPNWFHFGMIGLAIVAGFAGSREVGPGAFAAKALWHNMI
jgi:hypothetical protein